MKLSLKSTEWKSCMAIETYWNKTDAPSITKDWRNLFFLLLFKADKHKAAGKQIEAKQCKRLRRRFMWCSLYLEGDRIPPLKSYGQALKQECRFSVVLLLLLLSLSSSSSSSSLSSSVATVAVAVIFSVLWRPLTAFVVMVATRG